MRIDSAQIGMESERSYSQTVSRTQIYSVGVNTNSAFSTGGFNNMLNVAPSRQINNELSIRDQISKLREECINLLLRLLFPERELNLREHPNTLGMSAEDGSTDGILSIGRKTEYFYQETESTSFNAQGIVKCADGREINFGMELNMSRSFMEYYSEEVNFLESSLTDPLVINFDAPTADLSDMTFNFDIDSDGVEDQISRLVSGSGFLALDRNDDGVINDGSELFGAKTGQGFKELSEYDDDGDGFIDEDDAIFNKLRIMTVDEDGTQHLYSLKDKDIGAIYLGSQNTQFSLNGLATNENYGRIRSTGMFLHEDGRVGTVQQLDLAKRSMALAAYA